MKKFVNIIYKLFIPICFILICYFLFHDELITLPYINIIRYFILTLGLFLLLGGIIDVFNRGNTDSRPTNKNISSKIDFLRIYSEHIINYTFYIYFFIYMVFMLDKKSILYNYILLIIFGIFIGFQIAKKNSNK